MLSAACVQQMEEQAWESFSREDTDPVDLLDPTFGTLFDMGAGLADGDD